MPTRKKNKKNKGKPCDIEDFHPRHGGFVFKDGNYVYPDGYEFCEGKYRINREDFSVQASIMVDAMMSKSGKLIHRISHKPGDAWYMWRPAPHQWGWRYMQDGDPDLYVRTRCTFPRILDNPTLIPESRIDDALAERVGSSVHLHELCKRCFPDGH